MSGKIAANNGPVTKSDFTRLNSRVDSILSRLSDLSSDVRAIQKQSDARIAHSSNTSPSVNSKRKGSITSWLPFKSAHRSSPSEGQSVCKYCGNSDSGKNLQNRQANEEANDRLRNEFNSFQSAVSRDVRSLQEAVQEVKEQGEFLEKLVRDSVVNLQAMMENMSMQLVANCNSRNQQNFEKQAGNIHRRK